MSRKGPGRKESGNVAEGGSLALIPAIIEIRVRHVPRDHEVLCLCPRSIAPSLSTKLPGRPFGTSREKVKCSRDAPSAWIRDLPQLGVRESRVQTDSSITEARLNLNRGSEVKLESKLAMLA